MSCFLDLNGDQRALVPLPKLRPTLDRHPQKVARRLRAVTIAAWMAAGLSALFAAAQFLDPTPGVWKVATINMLGALWYASIPLLYRFGPSVAPVALIISAYSAIFILCMMIGRDAGLQLYYLAGSALSILFFGAERLVLVSALSAVAAGFIVALQVLAPADAGLLDPTWMFAN